MMFRKFLGLEKSTKDVFKAKDISTATMRAAVMHWYELYYKGLCGKGQSFAQRIPYTVVDAVYRACFGEYRVQVLENSVKGQLLNRAMADLDNVRAEAFQHTLIGGEVFIKPVPENGGFSFVVIKRPAYTVLGRNGGGKINAIGSSEVSWQDGLQYTLLEKRSVREDGFLCIDLSLFESRTKGAVGRKVPLDKIEKYSRLKEQSILPKAVGLGLVHVKTPMANCVEESWDGVSVFGAAAEKIWAAARHEQRIEDEYRLTKPHVIASVDIQHRGAGGEIIDIPEYITPIVDDEPGRAGLTVYNPAPNQAQLEARSQQHLRDIENIIGLRRGMLSCMEKEERTATEVQAANARWAMTVADFCGMWRRAVNDAAKMCDVMGQMYFNWDNEPLPPVVVSFGDGVLYDADKEFERMFRMAKEGWLQPEILAEWLEERGGGANFKDRT